MENLIFCAVYVKFQENSLQVDQKQKRLFLGYLRKADLQSATGVIKTYTPV